MSFLWSITTKLLNASRLVYETFPYMPAPGFTDKELADQTGKVYIVTGSTTGVGLYVAKYLYEKNAKIYIVGRNEDKAKNAITEIQKDCPDAKGSLDYVTMDFADLNTIKPGIAKFLQQESKLNGIVHNAGVMFPPAGSVTEQGYDLQIGVNCVGPQLLQHFLDDIVVKTAEQEPTGATRIVWITSAAHHISPDKGYNAAWFEKGPVKAFPQELYAMSKAVNIYQGYMWKKHHQNTKVLSLAVHPGYLNSELARHSFPAKVAALVMSYPPKFGAYTEIYGLCCPEITAENVVPYYTAWGSPSAPRQDIAKGLEEDGEKIWSILEEKVKEYL